MTVTVCIPAYNCANFIIQTVESVLEQTWSDWRLVIALDKSDDESESVCQSLRVDNRIELLVHEARQGWLRNFNFLLRQVQTSHFAMLFHDDMWNRNFLHQLMKALDGCP